MAKETSPPNLRRIEEVANPVGCCKITSIIEFEIRGRCSCFQLKSNGRQSILSERLENIWT
jgi:hypothetical protein